MNGNNLEKESIMRHLQYDGNNLHLESKFQEMKTKHRQSLITEDGKILSVEGNVFTFDGKVIDFDNDPVLNAKHEEAFKFLEKAGLPNFPPREK
jgi:hypothetical protein